VQETSKPASATELNNEGHQGSIEWTQGVNARAISAPGTAATKARTQPGRVGFA